MSLHTPVGLLLGLASSVLVIASPNESVKFISTIGIGLGVGVVINSEIGNSEHKKQLANLQKTVEIVDKQRKQAEQNQTFLTSEFKQKSESLNSDILILASENKKYLNLTNDLNNKITELTNELKIIKQKSEYELREITKFSTSSGFEIAQNTFEIQFKKLDGIIDGYKRNYPDLFEFFDNLESEIDVIKSKSIRDLEQYEQVKSLQSIIDNGLTIQERIISRCSDIKLKALITVVRYLNDLIKDSVKLSEYQRHLENLTEQAKLVIQTKESETEQIALKWLASNQQTQERYDSEFTETLNNGKYLVSRNQELLEKIESMQRPYTWSLATRNDLQIGNIIISYFERMGIILDRAESDFNTWESTLSFHIDRNPRIILPSELEPESEKLQQLCHTLSPIKFSWNSEKGLMQAWLHLSKKPAKPIEQNDINKIWKTSDKFKSLVKSWSRVRITGGSESGKSPTAENLAVCILLNRGGTAELFNPQDDSVKNYWTIPTVGFNHADSVSGIESLASKVNEKSGDRSKFKLSIFDEIDSTMSSIPKGEQGLIGQNVKTIIKQVSHQNLGVIFIGQNANVSEYPGMQRSDWNSAINVHIASNAYDALTNTNQITKQEQDRLKQQADKLTEFCEEKNTELGLEKTNPCAYRFALVMGDGKPYFIQLPDFGQFTYDMVENAVKCPACDSTNLVNNGKGRKKCKDCNHNFPG